MEPSIFHQKMKDLKQKLSLINEDIVEIQKNQKIKAKYSFKEKDNASMQIQENDFQIRNKNKSINLENPVYSLPHNDVIYNLTISSEVTPNKKLFYNQNFYDKVEDLRIKKKLEDDLRESSEQCINSDNNNNDNNSYKNYNIENIKKKKLKNKNTYSNVIDNEISFRQIKEGNHKIVNKFSNAINISRNPISLRANKKSISSKIKEKNDIHHKIKEIINRKYNDNILINNNNTICITCGNNKTIQRERKMTRKKIIPFSRKNNMKSNIFNLYSIVSPKNKALLNSKTVCFETNANQENNNNIVNNSSNNYELIKNENRTQVQCNGEESIPNCRLSDNILKVRRIIKNSFNNNNNTINNKDIIDIKKRKKINFNNCHKKKVNSISFNKLIYNRGNTLLNDKSNKIIKIQNKIFNHNEKSKNSLCNIDKEKLILNINKQLIKKQKKESSFKNSNISDKNIILNDNEISIDLAYKLNRNIVESRITNNFIIKLIKLYHDSTGLIINKENDLNTTLTILYNWIENMNKKNIDENKKENEDLQYKMLRQKIMDQYQLKSKNELKSFLTKILGNE